MFIWKIETVYEKMFEYINLEVKFYLNLFGAFASFNSCGSDH